MRKNAHGLEASAYKLQRANRSKVVASRYPLNMTLLVIIVVSAVLLLALFLSIQIANSTKSVKSLNSSTGGFMQASSKQIHTAISSQAASPAGQPASNSSSSSQVSINGSPVTVPNNSTYSETTTSNGSTSNISVRISSNSQGNGSGASNKSSSSISVNSE